MCYILTPKCKVVNLNPEFLFYTLNFMTCDCSSPAILARLLDTLCTYLLEAGLGPALQDTSAIE